MDGATTLALGAVLQIFLAGCGFGAFVTFWICQREFGKTFDRIREIDRQARAK